MRHNKKVNHLGRKSAHRQALLSNMASSLILHKRIFTTVAKAKALRVYVEPLITKAKEYLIETKGFTEPQAHRFMQRQSMRFGIRMELVAKRILENREL